MILYTFAEQKKLGSISHSDKEFSNTDDFQLRLLYPYNLPPLSTWK